MKSLGWLVLIVGMACSSSAQSLEEGIALFNKGKLGEAKSAFEAVLKQNESNAEAHYRLGLVFMSRQYRNEDDAVDHMERAVEMNPVSAEYQYGLGAAYGTKAQHAGVIKQAFLAPKVKKAFEKAVELNPKLVEAHVGLAQYYWRAAGFFYLQNQMTGDALASFEKYTAMRPDTAQSFHLLAQAYMQMKDADKALELAKKSLTLDNNYGPAIGVLAQAYELKGQKKEAREHYQRLLTMVLSENQRKNIEKKVNELQ